MSRSLARSHRSSFVLSLFAVLVLMPAAVSVLAQSPAPPGGKPQAADKPGGSAKTDDQTDAADTADASDAATNVVLILIDDLGWADLGCYGSDYYRTPHIDRLAAQGMRFTDAYSACNVCSPSRAAILTGKSPARLLLTQWLPSGRWDPLKNKLREARYVSNLPLEEVTLAETLRQHGYRTGFIGKWHLGTETYYFPRHQGFDVNIGGRDYGAPGDYFYPFRGKWKIPTTGQMLVKDPPVDGQPGDYLVDRLAEEAERFIRESKSQPFFLMLSHYAVHAPLQGKPDKVSQYQAIPKDRRQGNPEYAAMVQSVDESVGRVMRTLEQLKIADDTLVIFTSDNGGFAKATDNAPLRANKGSNYEGGIRVPLIIRWRGQKEPGAVCRVPVIGTDLYPTVLAALGRPARPYQHVDAENLLPLLRGAKTLGRDALFWHYPHYNQHPESFPSGVVRHGKWKFIEHYETGQGQLFDLESDLGETRDVAGDNADIAAQLRQRLHDWQRDVGADPMRPNPQYPSRSKRTRSN